MKRWSYVIASVVVVLWAIGVTLADTWVGDFQLHVATVRTLAEDFVHPPDPMVGVGSGSPYYSPYMLVVALVVRLTGAAPAGVLAVFGVFNVILLLVAFRRFVRCFSDSAVAATVALAALLLLWGPGSPGWSGFLDARSLAETLPYPSTVAFALMLLLWERVWRSSSLVVVGLLAAAIVLVHPFTALETAIGAVALAISARLPVQRWLGLAAAGAGATIVVALWPYSSIGDLFAGASALVAIHKPLRLALVGSGSLMCLYGLVGLPALAVRFRRDRLDPLVLMFVLAATVVFGALLTREHQYLRMIPVMMLPLQVAFGVFVVSREPASWRIGLAGASVVLFLGGFAVSNGPLLGAASALPPRWLPASLARQLSPAPAGLDADRVLAHAPRGATIMTDSVWTDRRLNLIGYYSVNPGWPNPWLRATDRDEAARAADRRELLDGGTTAARRSAVAARYSAACVLITRTPGVDAIDGYRRVDSWGTTGALFCR